MSGYNIWDSVKKGQQIAINSENALIKRNEEKRAQDTYNRNSLYLENKDRRAQELHNQNSTIKNHQIKTADRNADYFNQMPKLLEDAERGDVVAFAKIMQVTPEAAKAALSKYNAMSEKELEVQNKKIQEAIGLSTYVLNSGSPLEDLLKVKDDLPPEIANKIPQVTTNEQALDVARIFLYKNYSTFKQLKTNDNKVVTKGGEDYNVNPLGELVNGTTSATIREQNNESRLNTQEIYAKGRSDIKVDSEKIAAERQQKEEEESLKKHNFIPDPYVEGGTDRVLKMMGYDNKGLSIEDKQKMSTKVFELAKKANGDRDKFNQFLMIYLKLDKDLIKSSDLGASEDIAGIR